MGGADELSWTCFEWRRAAVSAVSAGGPRTPRLPADADAGEAAGACRSRPLPKILAAPPRTERGLVPEPAGRERARGRRRRASHWRGGRPRGFALAARAGW